MKFFTLLTLINLLCAQFDIKKTPIYDPNPVEVMTLGTFHFSYPGKDSHKTSDDKKIDVKTKQRQAELMEIINRIKQFNPTKILIEWGPNYQRFVDSTYAEYLNGNFELKHNEVYQIAYRLGKILGHKQLYCSDAPARFFKGDFEEYDDKFKEWADDNSEQIAIKNWNERYSQLYKMGDQYRFEHTLLESFKMLNDPEAIKASHGAYFTSRFDFESEAFDFMGVDGFISGWYNRNMRIFRNIKRYTESDDDRILLIIGAGHLPIINHVIDSAPGYEYVSPLTYLNK